VEQSADLRCNIARWRIEAFAVFGNSQRFYNLGRNWLADLIGGGEKII